MAELANIEETTADEHRPDYSESIKIAIDTLNRIEAHTRQLYIDVYGRQVAIAKNYIWVASTFIAFTLGYYDRVLANAFSSQRAITQWDVAIAVTLACIALGAAVAFFLSITISWGSSGDEHGVHISQIFYVDNVLAADPVSATQILAHYTGLIDCADDSLNQTMAIIHRKGLTLRKIGLILQVSFALCIVSLVIHLMEELL
ncbi:MAG: hypothetical protein E6234_06125 [Sutterella wadsworthensis]|nr:hypothetical protein [Sutterella wadsworthensis]